MTPSNPPPRATLAPGARVLERYAVETVVTRGAFWDVYTGSPSDETDRALIVRVLRRIENGATVADLLRRAQRLTTIAHPGLVPIVEVGLHDGALVVVSDDLPGVPLRAVLVDAPSHRLAARDTARIVRETADALFHLHTSTPPVLHGGLRPGQLVLVGSERRAVTLDWGLAQLVSSNALDPTTPQSYRAPEHARPDASPGPAADQFVLASIAFECLAGVRAFSNEQTAAGALDGAPRPWIASLRGDLPDIDAVLHRAWSVAPADRFPDVKAFATALSDLLSTADETGRSATLSHGPDSIDVPSPAPRVDPITPPSRSVAPRAAEPALEPRADETPSPVPPVRQRGAPWLAIGLGVVSLAAVGGVFVMRSHRDGPPNVASHPALASSRPPLDPAPVAAAALPAGRTNPTPDAPSPAAMPTPGTSITDAAPGPHAAPAPSHGPLRPGPIAEEVARVGAALQHQIDTCAIGQPRVQRHAFIGAVFEANGTLRNLHIVGAAASPALRECVEQAARGIQGPVVASSWSQSFHLMVP